MSLESEFRSSLSQLYKKIVVKTNRHFPHFNQTLHLEDSDFMAQIYRMLNKESSGFVEIAKTFNSLELTVEVEILNPKWLPFFTSNNHKGFDLKLLQKIKDRVYENDKLGTLKNLY